MGDGGCVSGMFANAACVASQSAWYRMENGLKSENRKKFGRKIENGPRPEMGEKWQKKMAKKIEK